jgi:REP element-mobilizing transposase RayT
LVGGAGVVLELTEVMGIGAWCAVSWELLGGEVESRKIEDSPQLCSVFVWYNRRRKQYLGGFMFHRRDFRQGEIFHVYNRGNHREMIFRDIPDRRLFLAKLDERSRQYGVTVLAYCLMDNHFHLLVRQDSWRPISQLMRSLMTGYVRSHNKKYGLVGRLFQSRYQASRIWNDVELAGKSHYIHRNPAKFTDYRTYRWSSARQYLTGEPVLKLFGESRYSYATFLENPLRTVLGMIQPGVRVREAARETVGGGGERGERGCESTASGWGEGERVGRRRQIAGGHARLGEAGPR